MVRSVAESWSLEPIGSLRLGTVDYPIPPLTFARFQRLLGLDAAVFAQAMTAGDVAAAWPWVDVCLPGVTRVEWEEHGTREQIARVFLMFVNGHDWEFIGESIRFGEPPAPGEAMPSQVDVASGLLAVARHSAHRIEDLLAMRVEGFYLLVEAIRQENDRQAEPEMVGPPPGIEMSSTIPGSLLDLMAQAEGANGG